MLPDILFYLLSFLAVFFAAMVIMTANPIHSALSLVMCMVFLATLFMHMDALLVAGVQLIVYAGAVMVLFVMVMMLFDLRREVKAFSAGQIRNTAKVAIVGLLAGLFLGAIFKSGEMLTTHSPPADVAGLGATKMAAQLLFTKYAFAFEVISVLLLVVVVGAVALSRIVGGTHAKH